MQSKPTLNQPLKMKSVQTNHYKRVDSLPDLILKQIKKAAAIKLGESRTYPGIVVR